MIDLNKIKNKYKNIIKYKNSSTQTANTKNSDELCVYLTKNRTFRIFNSKSYKEYVLSFNFGNSKKFIITKIMWRKFRRYIPYIERVLLNYEKSHHLINNEQHAI